MPEGSISPNQLEVEAELYFIKGEGYNSLNSAQIRLIDVMSRRGYDILHQGKRVWEFILRQRQPSPGFWWRLRQKIGLANEVDKKAERSIENLRGTRSNHPYRVKFRFIPTTWNSGDEGYIVEVECIPALRDKIDQLAKDFSDEDPKSAVRSSKSEVKDIATEVGFGILREPFTPAKNHEAVIETHLRKQLQEYKYGSNVTHFSDDADEALRYSLVRPAISAYVHGIEWAIICHIEEEYDRDLMEEEGYGRGNGFTELIEEIEDTGDVTQTTSEALRSMNTERIWMAHHKQGQVSEIEARRVKKRFSILLEELFL